MSRILDLRSSVFHFGGKAESDGAKGEKHSTREDDRIGQNIKAKLTSFVNQLNPSSRKPTGVYDPSKRPAAPCLRRPSSTEETWHDASSESLDSLSEVRSADFVQARSTTSVGSGSRDSHESGKMIKSVSFSSLVTIGETYSGAKYDRKGYTKKIMNNAELDRVIAEVNKFKALSMPLHPDSVDSIHFLQKTLPGQPRTTQIAMADLRRRGIVA